MTRARRLALVAVAAALAVLAASCSIPTQSDPSAIPASKVPASVLDPHLPTTTTTQPKSVVPVQVFFVNLANQGLQAVQRVVAPPASLTSIITALLAGTTEQESQTLTTAIPQNVSVLSATQAPGNVVVVNMNNAFSDILGINSELELAVGQIVATVAAAVGLGTGVIFQIEGQRTSVPVANGSEEAGPVYLLQFLGGQTPA